jgi:opacity protein-like surface antigen
MPPSPGSPAKNCSKPTSAPPAGKSRLAGAGWLARPAAIAGCQAILGYLESSSTAPLFAGRFLFVWSVPMKPVFRIQFAIPIAAALLAMPFQAEADEGYSLRVRAGADGGDGNYTVAGLALQWPTQWQKAYETWRVALKPELEIGSFRYHGDVAGPRRTEAVGGIAMFRFERTLGGLRPYGELGLGAALFNHEQLGGKRLSTAFQFSEHVGLGLHLGEHWTLGWRYSHYSNADIRLPNAGVDLQQVMLGFEF